MSASSGSSTTRRSAPARPRCRLRSEAEEGVQLALRKRLRHGLHLPQDSIGPRRLSRPNRLHHTPSPWSQTDSSRRMMLKPAGQSDRGPRKSSQEKRMEQMTGGGSRRCETGRRSPSCAGAYPSHATRAASWSAEARTGRAVRALAATEAGRRLPRITRLLRKVPAAFARQPAWKTPKFVVARKIDSKGLSKCGHVQIPIVEMQLPFLRAATMMTWRCPPAARTEAMIEIEVV